MGGPVDSIRRVLSWLSPAQKQTPTELNLVYCTVTGGATIDIDINKSQRITMATDPQVAADLKKKRTFRTFSYRGVELDKLLDLSNEEFVEIVHARARRRFQRGLKRRPMGLIKKLRKAKKEAPPNEKPAVVKTHLRDMIIVPEMIGSVVGIYNGKVFNSVEIKPEMVGHYLGEFSVSYKPVKHGRPGIGATHSSRFIPLK
ncbi:ribosomal protein S19-domain-containing protein [Russula compacta]|nr:ribosomal protein S19-domain-containing protein [Russula compacta]